MTKDRFNQDGMFCELGAELVDSAHEVLRGLAAELGVEVQEFGPFDAGVVYALYFFGGKIRTGAEMLPDFRPLAHLIDEDRLSLIKDGQVQIPTYSTTLGAEKWDRMSLKEYLDSKRGQGMAIQGRRDDKFLAALKLVAGPDDSSGVKRVLQDALGIAPAKGGKPINWHQSFVDDGLHNGIVAKVTFVA